MKRPLLAALSVIVLGISLVSGSLLQSTPRVIVECGTLDESNWGQLVPEGKEVDAIYGDIVLRNSKLTAVIAQTKPTRHANMTVRDVSGCLIDLTAQPGQSDQLAAYYPGRKAVAYQSTEIKATKKRLNPDSTITSAESVDVMVTAPATGDKPEVVTHYQLNAADEFLTVSTVYRNPGSTAMTVTLEDDFRADGGKEVMPRTPNRTDEVFWLHDRYWGQAYALDVEGRQIQINSDARTSQLKYVDDAGESKITLPAGESFTLTRRLYVGANQIDTIAARKRRNNVSVTPVSLQFSNSKNTPLPRAQVEFNSLNTRYGSATTDEHGLIQTALPPGDYAVEVTYLGQQVAKGLKLTIGETELTNHTITVPNENFGHASAKIIDAEGFPIPCKVEFIPQSPDVKLDFGPETAEFAVRNVCYTPNGEFRQPLPPGKYNVIVSHGPEFDAVFTEIDIQPFASTRLEAQLKRTVDTKGWVSSDFHSHSSPSGDNSSSQLGRVLNLVCEHIEFAPCTEHNRVTTYQPHIDRLNIGKFISSVEGMELTGSPLPLNHQNAFPMKFTPRTQDGGGPTTAASVEEQIERLALWDDRSEKLVQVNHPDIGWMFYDKNGDGQPDAGHERGFPFMDVMEIHPIQNALDLAPFATFPDGRRFHNSIFRWLQLLNQGFHIYGVVNTDAHYNFHGSGALRNWIQSPTDEPSEIKHMDMVHAAEQGRLVMSNGPFLEVSASEAGSSKSVTVGQDLAAPSKKITVKIKAQCPNWIDLDRMFVLVNGRIHSQHNYFREQHPDVFRSGNIKIDRQIELTLDGDAHVIIVVGDLGSDLSKVQGLAEGRMPATAITNPIFVDVDGNGFQANRDTLDAPLPVKFDPMQK
ncbi:MAG TPA: CehA/McbA family metallohydrolase [Planctomycetaceae bacterium]|nr:CehA/McbA family metallohydrolase [Planctomycetaceae bacterium]